MNFTSVSGKNWLFKKFDYADVKKYTENYSLNDVIAKLLSIRKENIENIDIYLNPTIKNLLPNPLQLKDMNKAVERIYQSLEKKELIGILGDYDVDGATSTALLKRYFLLLNQKTFTYIPDRMKEGYGPSVKSFSNFIKLGAKVIFTVDCGTLSFEPIKIAQNQNTDVIVLDHHQSDTKLPNAYAIINPNRCDENSELHYLCAAGVCFMFLVALNKKLREKNWFKNNHVKEPDILDFLDLVSLGTVCDVVPLVGLNRAIVKQGLKILKKRSNLGLKVLVDLCKIESEPTTYDLGYKLGPRINAAGRIGKSSHGVNLLSSDDQQKVYQIALDLEKFNNERKSIEQILSEQVEIEIKNFQNDPVLVLSGKSWHEGIIGIVASRIKEKYNKPTILISLNKNLGKGSARSISGFNIGNHIIKSVQLGILENGGGHKMAGGFSIKKENISKLRSFLIKNFSKHNKNNMKNMNFYIDSIIAPSALNENFYDQINLLAPFGSGNSEPKFVLEDLRVVNSSLAGLNHIKTILSAKDGSIVRCIAFNAKNTPLEAYLNMGNKKRFNIAGKIKLNKWRGKKNIDFEIEDISIN